MSMFDSISVDQKLIEKHNIRCKDCNSFSSVQNWQTKDFENCMDEYCLCEDEKGDTRLYKLDPPSQEYWAEYTKEEIEEKNKNPWPWLKVELGDGYYKQEGFLPENRKKRHMGELPHQIVSIYVTCDKCRIAGEKYLKGWIELDIKFTDGVAVKISQKGE